MTLEKLNAHRRIVMEAHLRIVKNLSLIPPPALTQKQLAFLLEVSKRSIENYYRDIRQEVLSQHVQEQTDALMTLNEPDKHPVTKGNEINSNTPTPNNSILRVTNEEKLSHTLEPYDIDADGFLFKFKNGILFKSKYRLGSAL